MAVENELPTEGGLYEPFVDYFFLNFHHAR